MKAKVIKNKNESKIIQDIPKFSGNFFTLRPQKSQSLAFFPVQSPNTKKNRHRNRNHLQFFHHNHKRITKIVAKVTGIARKFM